MTSRLLAFVLACIIGSPTCWCCLPQGTASAKTATRSCCHGSKTPSDATGKPAKRQNCPCALSLTKRDLADGKVLLPKPVAAADLLQAHMTEFLPAPMAVRAGQSHVDEDPPWRSQRLYLRHCAQLL